MINIDKELDRYLLLLRNKIRESGFIQLEVQQQLGWGRSYISQLLTKQKALRLEQVLLILKVIGVEPQEFFMELYTLSPGKPESLRPPSVGQTARPKADMESAPTAREMEETRALARGLTELLLRKGVVTVDGLAEATRRVKNEPWSDTS